MDEEIDHVRPLIGSWYRDVTGAIFEVVAIDNDDGTIEVQHFDGNIEEFDLDMWWETPMEHVEPPEDWSGSLDIEREDYGVDLGDVPNEEWSSALEFLDQSET